jgi:hypothetical protein
MACHDKNAIHDSMILKKTKENHTKPGKKKVV